MSGRYTCRFFLWLLAPLLVVGCGSDDEPQSQYRGEASVSLRFESRFQGQPYPLNLRATNIHDCTFEVSGLRFYLSNVKLHTAGGERDLADVVLIDVADESTFPRWQVPAGSYSAVSFDLGVPISLNGTQNPDFTTALFDAEHPLSESNGMYWAWATGYRFFVFEGRYDTVPDAEGNLSGLFSFHTGLDTLFRELPPFELDLDLPGGASRELPFHVSIDSLFATHADTLDLRHSHSFHGNNLPDGIRAANNSARSFVFAE